MSRGWILASSTRASSSGTISTMSRPGLTTPPTVLANRRCTRPRTGDFTCDLSTLSARATAPSVRAFRRASTSDSSLRASLRKLRSVSWILREASLIAACARALWAPACSMSPRARLTSRSSRNTSTSETAPVASSGRVLLNSCCDRSMLRCAELRRAWASLNSWRRCASCWSLIDSMADSSERLASYNWRSSSRMRASSRLPSCAAGGSKAVPSARAFRRAAFTRREKAWAALSRTPDVARVSSIFSSNCPASTTWPSFTRISETTPPSSDWMTCSCRDGITLASPLVTSSTWATLAQTINTTVTTTALRTRVWARWVRAVLMMASASCSKLRMPAWAAVLGSTRGPARVSRTRLLMGASPRRRASSTSRVPCPILCMRDMCGAPLLTKRARCGLPPGPA